MAPKNPLPDRLRRWAPLLAAFLAAVIGITLTITLTDSNKDGRRDTLTIHVDNADANQARDNTITVPIAAVDAAASSEVGHHDQLRSETPPQVPLDDLAAGQAQQERFAASDQEPILAPFASDTVPGCVTRYVVNQSSRRGVAPRLFVLHETVSPNRAGWSDVNAIVALFNRPSFSASSNFVIDHEGHCAYIVNLGNKAWAQAGFNSVAVSVEMIDTATRADGSYADGAGLAKLGKVFREVHRRYPSIAAQRGATSGCSVTRSGIVDHATLGSCGGGHVDITPWNQAGGLDRIARSLLTPQPVAITASRRATCRKLHAFLIRRSQLRRHGKHPGPKSSAAAHVASRAFDRQHLRCTAKGLVRT